MPYGGPLPTLTASYDGLVNGDTSASLTTAPTLATTATAHSHVAGNPYSITASGAVDTDYDIHYVAGKLTVTPVTLTITADNKSMPYGGPLPTLAASYDGFVNGDTSTSLTTLPALATTATASSHVSGNPYSITASGAVDADYDIHYVSGKLTVMAAPLTISADDKSMLDGGPLPALTASYDGLVNGDTSASLTTAPTLATTAMDTSPVGDYAITVGGAVDNDYDIRYHDGKLTVTKAVLKATATPVTTAMEGIPFVGEVATFTDSNPNAPPAIFPLSDLTIDWGDGVIADAVLLTQDSTGVFHVYGAHVYNMAGVMPGPLQVTVADTGGSDPSKTSNVVTVGEVVVIEEGGKGHGRRLGPDSLGGDTSSTGSGGSSSVPVITAATIRIPLDQLRDAYGFHYVGNYDQSYDGLNAKWFQDRSGHWYALFDDGSLESWTKFGNREIYTPVAAVDKAVFADPQKLFEAPVQLSEQALDKLFTAEQANGFHATGNYWENWLGEHEKWFQDRDGNWFVITTDGQIERWQKGGLGAPVASVDPLVWDNPDLLFEQQLSQTTQTQLSQLHHDHGFHYTGDYDLSYGGLNAKWFQDRNNQWYALFSDGTLKSWQLVNGKDKFTFVATLDPAVYADPQLLFQAPVAVSTTTLAQLQQDHGFQFVGTYWLNWLGQNEKWFVDRMGNWFALTTDGQIRAWTSTGLDSALATVDPLVWDDPNLLFEA
jgi:hypothetical protein